MSEAIGGWTDRSLRSLRGSFGASSSPAKNALAQENRRLREENVSLKRRISILEEQSSQGFVVISPPEKLSPDDWKKFIETTPGLKDEEWKPLEGRDYRQSCDGH